MNFVCQQQTIEELKLLADSDRHSILIDGPSGCGKSYLAEQYRKLVGAESLFRVDPTVSAIRDCIVECYNLDHKCVICIENLDSGVPAASYALLKFIEEPISNIYVVVTCVSMLNVPDTIVSRSACVSVSPPTDADIEHYASNRDHTKFSTLRRTSVWNSVKSFQDVELVFKLNSAQLEYYRKLTPLTIKDSTGNLVWRLSHYDDDSATPVNFVIRYIMCNTNNSAIIIKCIDCLKDLQLARIGQHAVLSKFVLELKYS